MKLAHYTKHIKLNVVSRDQTVQPHMKPYGLWVSDDNAELSWPKLQVYKNYQSKQPIYKHMLRLDPQHNVRIIRSIEELDAFSVAFDAGLPWNRTSTFGIRWRLVAERYQGIIITPYLHERRYSPLTNWYWSWDCASGCIWDINAIEYFQVLGSPVGKTQENYAKTG